MGLDVTCDGNDREYDRTVRGWQCLGSGPDTELETCSTAEDTEYVVEPCVSGTISDLGTDTTVAPCSVPDAGSYVTEACLTGTASLRIEYAFGCL